MVLYTHKIIVKAKFREKKGVASLLLLVHVHLHQVEDSDAEKLEGVLQKKIGEGDRWWWEMGGGEAGHFIYRF